MRWGLTACDREWCDSTAILWAGPVFGALCARCADELLERIEATALAPVLRETLPPWDE